MSAWAVWMDACEDAGICAGEHVAHDCMRARRVFREPMVSELKRALRRYGWPPALPLPRPVLGAAEQWCHDPHADPGVRLAEHRWCQPLPGSEQWERGY